MASVAMYAVSAGVVGVLCYVPVVAAYGFEVFRFSEGRYPGAARILRAISLDLWGALGVVSLAIAALAVLWRSIAQRGRVRESGDAARGTPDGARVAVLAAAAAAVTVFGAAYLRLPHDAAYLVPAVPFVILALVFAVGTRTLRVVFLLMIASPFLLEIGETAGRSAGPSGGVNVPIRVAGKSGVLRLTAGALAEEKARRVRQVSTAEHVLRVLPSLPDSSVVVSWTLTPVLQVLSQGRGRPAVRFEYLLDSAEADSLRRQRRAIFFLARAEPPNRRITGLDLREFGARGLPIEDR
jgi:hypothetical protein